MAGGEFVSKSHEDRHASANMQHLVVLLPVLNEALGLDWVLNRLPSDALKAMGFSVSALVMDGHSTDQTRDVAAEHGVHFLEQHGHGKGTAIRHGFREALNMGADVVVMLDADGTYAPDEMTKLIARLERYDVVIGDRLSGNIAPTAMTRMNFVGNHLLTWFATALYGVTTKDVCSGYWAFSQRSIETLMLNSVSFEIEAEMYANMVHQNISFGYHPISYGPRIGEAKLGSTADGWKILRKLVTRRILPNPTL